jgi:Fe-S-cluster containining protein
MDLDQARHLINFEHIQLTLSAAGEWNAYYVYPCRFLDRETFRCTVHATPHQPRTCVHYNPYQCLYKRLFTASVGTEILRLDHQRVQFIASQMEFDDRRQIVAMPAWEALVEGCRQLPVLPPPEPTSEPGPDRAAAEWRRQVIAIEEVSEPGAASRSFASLGDPCDGCGAYCCQTLVFPQPALQSAAHLDFLRFCLGFPGVEVGLNGSGWQVIVYTRCRHLEQNRCGIYGQPERPLLCKYYDALKCTFKPRFGQARAPDFLKVGLEHFGWLSECYALDDNGRLVGAMALPDIRGHIETRWRESVAASTIQ